MFLYIFVEEGWRGWGLAGIMPINGDRHGSDGTGVMNRRTKKVQR